ncbi:MAG: YdcF family protein [Lachnospiraceae bacterium]|nr:YdcF family protein [Lachnospiraceae bacterium]
MNIKQVIVVVSLIIFGIGIVLAYLLLRNTKGGSLFDKVSVYVYMPVAIWSLVYFFVCIRYAGIRLSLIWLWLAVTAFCVIRIVMLKAGMDGKALFHVPGGARIVYRFLVGAALLFFLLVERRIVDAMKATPPAGLDYVIVLGAGLNGRAPSNPLRVRIQRGAEYLQENPDTLLVASGGKGANEVISEAKCIMEQLTYAYNIDESRIIMESMSRDTEENLQNSLKLIGDPDASVGIITNGFHEYRAMLIAKHAGYRNVHTVPATTLLPVGIHYVVREFFGVVECMLKYGEII